MCARRELFTQHVSASKLGSAQRVPVTANVVVNSRRSPAKENELKTLDEDTEMVDEE